MRNLKAILVSEGLMKGSRRASGVSLDFSTFRALCSNLMAGYGTIYAPFAKLIARGDADSLVRGSYARIVRMLASDGWDGDITYLGEFSDLLNDLMGSIISENSGDFRRPYDAFDRRPSDMLEEVSRPTWQVTGKVLSQVLARM